jgi:hypothetical protein
MATFTDIAKRVLVFKCGAKIRGSLLFVVEGL